MTQKKIPRWLVTILAFLFGTSLIVPAIQALVQANITKLAEKYGWDQLLTTYWEPIMSWWASITQSSPFIFVAAFFIGGAVFLWADYFTRRKIKFPTELPSPRQLIKDKTFLNCEVALDDFRFVDCTFQNVTFRWNGTTALEFMGC